MDIRRHNFRKLAKNGASYEDKSSAVCVDDVDHVQVNPTTITAAPKPRLKLTKGNAPASLQTEWNGGCPVEFETLNGPWTGVMGAGSPFPIKQTALAISGGSKVSSNFRR